MTFLHKIFRAPALALLVSLGALHAFAADPQSQNVLARFELVKQAAASRWQSTFQGGQEFSLFRSGKPDDLLKEEFALLYQKRKQIWKTSGFELAQHLVDADLIRAPGCVAFLYNNTTPSYNASTICLGKRRYIACEGPRSKDVPNFFDLLVNQHVTHLVRLTSPYEGWTKKCHPYWHDLIETDSGGSTLNIHAERGVHPVRAFHMDYWRDHQGVNPEQLLDLVLQVRKELDDVNGLLVVHCSAGVGRTGTFLAALAIVDAIDQGEPFSIEEIVYRLSLQRVHSVAKLGQYLTLHRLAECYLNRI